MQTYFFFIRWTYHVLQTPSQCTTQQPNSATPSSMPHYSHWVQIINPIRKKDVIIRKMRRFHGHFSSITDLKVRLMEEFQDSVPQTTKFAVGYFQQSIKHWICSQEDLNALYTTKDKQLVVLWCDGRLSEEHVDSESTPRSSKKRVKSVLQSEKRKNSVLKILLWSYRSCIVASWSSMTPNIVYGPEW